MNRRLRRATRPWAWLMIAGLALTFTWSSSAGADQTDPALTQAIDTILADHRLDGAGVSVVVKDATTGDTLYTHQGQTRLMPASNTKLATSTAAMDILGPDYRYQTEVLTDGKRTGPALAGDVYLRGTGDPTMLAKDYDELAAKVAASGIKQINGKLVADDTRFDTQRLGRSWAADDEAAYYSAQISPLTVAPDTDFDAGTVIIEATPGARAGDPAHVTVTPKNSYVTVDNRGATVAKGQGDTLSVDREHGTNTITVSGNIPLGGATTKEWISVWEPTGYAASVFADALAAHGVRVTGATLLGQPTPHSATALASHSSMTLRELMIPFLKLSNNGHAEVLTKTIGFETAGRGSWSAGLNAISGYLKTQGVDTSTLRQVDGSGLSRMDNFPGDQLATLLTSVRKAPWFADWFTALPVACDPDRFVGGTLRSRMCNTPAARNARGKTGSLTGAAALSGYVTDADGKDLVYSVVLNNYLAASVTDIADRIVVTLASRTKDQTAAAVVPRSRIATGPASELECSWLKPRTC